KIFSPGGTLHKRSAFERRNGPSRARPVHPARRSQPRTIFSSIARQGHADSIPYPVVPDRPAPQRVNPRSMDRPSMAVMRLSRILLCSAVGLVCACTGVLTGSTSDDSGGGSQSGGGGRTDTSLPY